MSNVKTSANEPPVFKDHHSWSQRWSLKTGFIVRANYYDVQL